MKIKSFGYILIAVITIIPFLVGGIIFVSRQIEKRELVETAKSSLAKYKKALSTNNWSDFSLDQKLTNRYHLSLAIIDPSRHIVYSTIPDMENGEIFDNTVWTVIQKDIGRYTNFIAPVSEYMKQLSIDSNDHVPVSPKGYFLFLRIENTSNILLPDSAGIKEVVIYVMICILIVIVLVAINLIWRITTSISKLSTATQNVAAGILDKPLEVSGNDEICALGRSFNTMQHEIKENALRKSRLIIGLSHDFKTPLALIKGYTEVLEKETNENQPDTRKYLGIIESKTEQLENMLDDLLDFVSIDSGEWRYSFEKINLYSWITNFILRSKNDARLLGKTLSGTVTISREAYIFMDESLIERALDNLVHNAFRYTGIDGSVSITVRESLSGYILEISDNGTGIAETDRPYVFDMFYRGTPSRQTQGMGLGLAVVKNIIEAHNWIISFETGNGGTIFKIQIPVITLKNQD